MIRENRIPTDEVFIIAGTRYRYDQDGSVRREARNITIHPNYTFDPLNNNLAIIEVSGNFDFDVKKNLGLFFAAQRNVAQ